MNRRLAQLVLFAASSTCLIVMAFNALSSVIAI